MSFTEHNKNGLVYMTSPVIACPHAFSTRLGGVSGGIFESLNLSTTRGDAPELVAENYRRLTAVIGTDMKNLAFTRQVHKADVRIVTGEDRHTLFTPVPYEADGIVASERGLALICFTADCVPVLLCDRENGVIAAVHCGWRSSVGDILNNAVSAMRSLGAREKSICAAIGPAIDYCCFQVGAEVIEAAEKYLGGQTQGLYRPEDGAPGKYRLDLKGANRRRLLQLGLCEENISVSDECTMCLSDKYWSHRKTSGQRGSQGSLIMLD